MRVKLSGVAFKQGDFKGTKLTLTTDRYLGHLCAKITKNSDKKSLFIFVDPEGVDPTRLAGECFSYDFMGPHECGIYDFIGDVALSLVPYLQFNDMWWGQIPEADGSWTISLRPPMSQADVLACIDALNDWSWTHGAELVVDDDGVLSAKVVLK
jgi:hypothetical protein